MKSLGYYIQARNLLEEARMHLKDYSMIMSKVKHNYSRLRVEGITCKAFFEEEGQPCVINVTRQCWNHVFHHPQKRQSRLEKLERALCLNFAITLLQKTTTTPYVLFSFFQISTSSIKQKNNI